MSEEYDIKELLKDVNVDMHDYYNGLFLTKKQVEMLDRYGFNYHNYNNLKSLIFDLNNFVNDNECIELENILYEISEFDYYNNTDK